MNLFHLFFSNCIYVFLLFFFFIFFSCFELISLIIIFKKNHKYTLNIEKRKRIFPLSHLPPQLTHQSIRKKNPSQDQENLLHLPPIVINQKYPKEEEDKKDQDQDHIHLHPKKITEEEEKVVIDIEIDLYPTHLLKER